MELYIKLNDKRKSLLEIIVHLLKFLTVGTGCQSCRISFLINRSVA